VFTINTKSILTRAVVLAGSAGLLASLGAVGASAASASTHRNQTLTATTKIVNRYDGGGIKGTREELLACMASVKIEDVFAAVTKLI